MMGWFILPFWNLPSVVSAQAYPTVVPQNVKFICALGNVCAVTSRLPTSATISGGLKKRGKGAVSSGGLADTWEGKYRCGRVAIKAFRAFGQSKETEELVWKVRVQSPWETRSRTKIIDSAGTGARVEEAIP
jgi:hypothetical protein